MCSTPQQGTGADNLCRQSFVLAFFPSAGTSPRPPRRCHLWRGPRGGRAGSGAERRPPLGDGSARRARSCARARPSERGWAASHSAASRASGGQKGAGKRDLRKARAGAVGGERFLIFPEIKQKTELLMSVNSEKSSSPERYGRIPVRMNAGLLPLASAGLLALSACCMLDLHRAHPACPSGRALRGSGGSGRGAVPRSPALCPGARRAAACGSRRAALRCRPGWAAGCGARACQQRQRSEPAALLPLHMADGTRRSLSCPAMWQRECPLESSSGIANPPISHIL